MKIAKLVRTALLILAFGASSAFASNLIEYEGGQASPNLAKSWKKVKDGEYEFVLDTSKEVKKGVNVSPELVKDSLEKKLGKTLGVKVTKKSADTVSVTYTGDEETFLDKVAKTKIRASSGTDLALESSVSEGGIRANKFVRAPNDGEVKAQVVKLGKGWIQAMVNTSKSPKIKGGAFKLALKEKVAVGNAIVFTPGEKDGDVWKPAAGKEVLIGK